MAKSHVATPFRRMVLEGSLLADGRFSFCFVCRISPVWKRFRVLSLIYVTRKRGTVVRKPVPWGAKHMARARGVLGKKSQGYWNEQQNEHTNG